jgi:hypothetical protein
MVKHPPYADSGLPVNDSVVAGIEGMLCPTDRGRVVSTQVEGRRPPKSKSSPRGAKPRRECVREIAVGISRLDLHFWSHDTDSIIFVRTLFVLPRDTSVSC